MQTVSHKIYGVGEVIKKETTEGGIYITVKFESGKEARFSIPDSFTLGIMVAEGNLKEEVDAAIAEKKAREAARLEALKAASAVVATVAPSHRHGRTPTSPVTVKGSIERAFEKYLINAGYAEYTASGNPSTVFSYTHAIKKVLQEEGLSWHALQNDIENIVPVYDIGGSKQHIGALSNCTVINALKRFAEFVNPNLQTTVDSHLSTANQNVHSYAKFYIN